VDAHTGKLNMFVATPAACLIVKGIYVRLDVKWFLEHMSLVYHSEHSHPGPDTCHAKNKPSACFPLNIRKYKLPIN